MRQKGSLIGDLFNMDVLFGILVGIAVPFLVWVSMQANAIKDYQDLIAGIMALFGAAIAVIAVMHQIRHAQEMEDERRARQMYAARSMMPHALESLCDYAEACCRELKSVVGTLTLNQPLIPLPAKLPPLPGTVLPPLQKLLEFGDIQIQDCLTALMHQLQMQQSRFKHSQGGVKKSEYYARVTEALEVWARAATLFDYARRYNQKPRQLLTRADLQQAADVCKFPKKEWAELHQIIDNIFLVDKKSAGQIKLNSDNSS